MVSTILSPLYIDKSCLRIVFEASQFESQSQFYEVILRFCPLLFQGRPHHRNKPSTFITPTATSVHSHFSNFDDFLLPSGFFSNTLKYSISMIQHCLSSFQTLMRPGLLASVILSHSTVKSQGNFTFSFSTTVSVLCSQHFLFSPVCI